MWFEMFLGKCAINVLYNFNDKQDVDRHYSKLQIRYTQLLL